MRQLRAEQGAERSLYPDTRDNVIYGHIHMAKTAGTNLNGLLALNYERVCGNKGYSYDAYLTNERNRNGGDYTKADDSFNKFFTRNPDEQKSRGRVPLSMQLEIGFEDCDYISMEQQPDFWDYFESFHGMSLELHLPCRDPMEHLMSQCNHLHINFNCDSDNLKAEVWSCLMSIGRFSNNLLRKFDVKCYDYKQQFTGYMEYMSSKLSKKRIQSDYVSRSTNEGRNKNSECIWKRPEVKLKVLEILQHQTYYKFCRKCLGSSGNLLFNRGQDVNEKY